jgi:hypothetical protein
MVVNEEVIQQCKRMLKYNIILRSPLYIYSARMHTHICIHHILCVYYIISYHIIYTVT